jgi:NAD(P)-dependent dehydrogenase (short-subunit alcohol dehydrogenase family)
MQRFAAEAGIYGQPEEIADLIAFLVSPAARWMTGRAVRMDGGEAKAIEAKAADAHPPQRGAVLDSDLSYVDTGAGYRMRLGSH